MTTGDLTAERIALNDATFREANEKIAATAQEFGLDRPIPFVCECADPACTAVVLVEPHEYREVRENPRWFLNVPGHQALMLQAGAGVVTSRRSQYVVVEKTGRAGEVAASLDPRSSPRPAD